MRRLKLFMLGVLLLIKAHLKYLFALVLLGLGVALAQGTDLPRGIPVEYEAVVTVLIGLLSALLVQPATAIAKKLGGTQGVTTVAISGALSIVVALGFMFAQAASTRQSQGWGEVVLVALVAFVKANGDYIGRVFANTKANVLAPPSVMVVPPGEVTPPAGVKAPPSGFEQLPPQAQGFLGSAAVALTLDLVIEQVLGQAQLQPTPARLARIGARLAQVAPDLLDGSAYLSAQSRNVVLGVVMDLKKEGGL